MKTKIAFSMVATLLIVGCGGNSNSPSEVRAASKLGGVRVVDAQVPSVTEFAVNGFRTNYAVVRNIDNTITVTDKIAQTSQTYPATTTLLKFYDKYTSFDTTDMESKVYRLYQAAFNRKPEPGGLGFWLKAAQNGASFDVIAQSFIDSAEFINAYGAHSNADFFINTMYNNVLHRAGETAGVNWWVAAVNNGAPRAGVLQGFSESAENQKNLLPALTAGYDYIPYQSTTIASGSCKPYDWKTNPEEFQLDDYSVKNNMWNRAVVPENMTYTNCTQGIDISSNTIAANWSWSLPPIDYVNITGAVKGFPEIEFGKNPGGLKWTTTKLPLQVGAIKDMSVNYDMTIQKDADTIYNTFFDIYYMPTANADGVSQIAFNLALWVDHAPSSFLNSNAYTETITIDNVMYDVYVNPPSPDVIAQVPYVQIVAQTSQMKAAINIGKFTAYLISKGWVTPTQYLTSVEFGTEMVAGKGNVTVKSYSIAM